MNEALAAHFLSRLRTNPETALAAITETCAAYPHSSAELMQLAASLAEDDGPAVPADGLAGHCSWCGAPSDLAAGDLEPGPDGPDWPQRYCSDLDECVANRELWYPPDSSRVPIWLTAVNQAADAGEVVRLACDQAARQFILELSQRPDPGVLELTGQTGGSSDPDQLPYAVPYAQARITFDNWSHTLRGGQQRGHLISGGRRWGAPVGGDVNLAAQSPAPRPGQPRDPQPRGGRRPRHRRLASPGGRPRPRTADGSDDMGTGGVDTGGPSGGAGEGGS